MELLKQQIQQEKKESAGLSKEEIEKKRLEKKEKFITFTMPDKGGKVTSKIRFIEPVDNMLMFYEYRRHETTIGKDKSFFICPRVDKQKCPICDSIKEGTRPLVTWFYDNDNEFYKLIKAHTSYVWLALVRSSSDKTVEQTVKYIVVTKDVHQKILAVIMGNPDLDEAPIPIFDFEHGCDFVFSCWYENVNTNGSSTKVFKTDIAKSDVKKLNAKEIELIKNANLINPKSFMEENKKVYNLEDLTNTVNKTYDKYKNLKNGLTPSEIPNVNVVAEVKTGTALDLLD